MQTKTALSTLSRSFSWLRPWMLTTLLALAYVLFSLARANWDPMDFVKIGSIFDPSHATTYEMGYDGQFAYQIAINPAGASPYLDVPAYRYQRILYPMLARLLALGSPAAIPWTMILINLASLALGTLATEKILANHGKSRIFALAYGLFAGLFVSLRLDLTEPLAFALVQWGVLEFDRRRIWRSVPFFMLAALTRELSLLFAAACAVYLLTNKQVRTGIIWGFLALLPFAVWQVVLRLWLGSWGVRSGGALAAPFELIPFRGWWGYLPDNTVRAVLLSVFVLFLALIPAALGIFAGLRSLVKRRWGLGVWILLLNAAIFPFLPTSNVLVQLDGLARMTIGLIAAFLDYGAMEDSNRSLVYSQLWILLLAYGENLMWFY